MFPVSLLKSASIAPILPVCGNLLLVRQHEFDLLILLILLRAGHVFEVAGLGYVEINPHHAVIGQGREDVPLLDQAALLLVQAVDDAVERCFDLGKVQFGLRQLRLGLGLCQFGLEQRHLILRDTLFVGQLLGVIELQLRELCSRPPRRPALPCKELARS